jgi:hypothetical protein
MQHQLDMLILQLQQYPARVQISRSPLLSVNRQTPMRERFVHLREQCIQVQIVRIRVNPEQDKALQPLRLLE